MRLPESVARCQLLATGVNLEYESPNETLAIGHILNERQIEYTRSIIGLAEKPQEVNTELRSLYFPDKFYADVSKSVEAKRYFDKIRDEEFFIMPM